MYWYILPLTIIAAAMVYIIVLQVRISNEPNVDKKSILVDRRNIVLAVTFLLVFPVAGVVFMYDY